MYTIKGEIEGIAPILFNRMSDEEARKLPGGPQAGATGGRKKPKDHDKMVLEKLHRNGKGIFLPNEAFEACLKEGCWRAGLKYGKSGLANFLAATVFVEGELLFGKKEPDYVDGRRASRSDGTGVWVSRPALKEGWKLPFTLLVTDDRRDADQIKIALEEAGLLCGLGSYRPKFGRFIITKWAVQDKK